MRIADFALSLFILPAASHAFVPATSKSTYHAHDGGAVPQLSHYSTTASTTTTRLYESKVLWRVQQVDHISDWTAANGSGGMFPNPLSLGDNVPSSWFVGLNDAVAAKVQIDALETIDDSCLLDDDMDEESMNGDGEVDCSSLGGEAFILAGPRREIAFDPKKCKAAIVTCGGLCPG